MMLILIQNTMLIIELWISECESEKEEYEDLVHEHVLNYSLKITLEVLKSANVMD